MSVHLDKCSLNFKLCSTRFLSWKNTFTQNITQYRVINLCIQSKRIYKFQKKNYAARLTDCTNLVYSKVSAVRTKKYRYRC